MFEIIVDLVILRIVFWLTRDYMNMNVGYGLPCICSVLLSIADLCGAHLNCDGEGGAVESLFQDPADFLHTTVSILRTSVCLVNRSEIYWLIESDDESCTSSDDRSLKRGTTLRGMTRQCPGTTGFKLTNAAHNFVA